MKNKIPQEKKKMNGKLLYFPETGIVIPKKETDEITKKVREMRRKEDKIPQEIEKRLTRTLIKAVDESKEVWFQMGFKAGQKQSEDAFKEMIEEWNIIYDNGTSFFEKKDGSFRTNSGEVFVKELLSQLNSKEKN